MKSTKIIAILILAFSSCSDQNTEINELQEQEKEIDELIIGTWHVYNISVLDKNRKELELPGYLSIECDAITKYKFLRNGEFIMEDLTTWHEKYNQENQIIGGTCDKDDEGGGFDSGNWYIDFDENGEKILDINWVYKSLAEDGTLWQPEFLSQDTFLISDFDTDDEKYYLTYYERIP
ncbi:hypothetical protein D1013_08925 [Euzebyella marina]|uniref:Lipocalin-like domain-containing protein n=1 Tax=Euzebyella marina TaxID=1761453 RepID=A0A3G2L5C4_9FLAO|nr:hypothetical protein [Euzebyella marina]AYN67474.1 hypothetical protein D1013_08925 [Euzebyella marina]